MKAMFVAMGMLFAVNFAYAEEVAKEGEAEGLALEQKLARVYDLYRREATVSLKPSEMQAGVGVVYTTGTQETFGLRQSVRALTTQVFASRGVGHGMEISVALPYSATSRRVETSEATLAKSSAFGGGDTTIRLLGTLPTKEVSTTAILSATLPTGKHELSHNEAHTSLGASWSKVLRPAFVSGGASWERDWQSDVNGLGYNLGMGFFLNHALSLGGEIAGVLVLNPEMGAVQDTQSMGLKVAYQTTPDFGVVVSTNIGIGTSAPQSSLGMTTYWRF
ncbi:MAG: hypothetical protein AAB552_01080 [Patescibacteria group bacterium]